MSKSEMIETQKFTKFFGFETPLSSLRFSKFKLGNVEYPSLEHYHQYQKAKHFNDQETMKAVLQAKTPNEARKLGQRWPDEEPGWMAVAFDVMWKGCLAKFTQNDGARKYLFKTAGTKLVNCNPWDKLWGIGVAKVEKRSNDPSTWQGKNWSGQILMMAQENLMNRPEYEDEVAKIEAEKTMKK